jgi:cytochrome c biogenesis protein CcmG, thiol:disulfide interchange protein DsbE
MNITKPLLLLLTLTVACSSSGGRDPRVVTAEVGGVGPSAPLATMPPTSTPYGGANDGDGEAIGNTSGSLQNEDAVGERAPGFAAESFERSGQPVRLMKRKVTVLHFFATWCGPCKMSMPKFDKIQKKYAERGMMTIGVSVDDEKAGVLEFAKQNGVTFPIGYDNGHDIAQRYKVMTMPQTFVIDRDGIVRAVYSGYHDGEDMVMEKLIKTLL